MMKAWVWAAASVSLALAACGGSGGESADDGNENRANAAVAANASAGDRDAAAGPETPDANAVKPAGETGAAAGASASASSPPAEIRALLIGRWAEGGDCAAATEFREDGTFSSAAAGNGRWAQSNEYLTLSGSRTNVEFAVQEIDGSSMVTINPDGHIGRWTRC